VVDPLAGSYYVESLTNELIARAQTLIREVDELGGSIAAIESGWMQSRIADSAYQAQQAVENGEQVVVGVNKFAERGSETVRIPLQRIDDAVQHDQVTRLHAFKAKRDASLVEARLAAVRKAAGSGENLMPYFIDAVDAGATLGEVCVVLRDVFGVYRAPEVVA
jgi:methylmalonyl-CoA mutase N-terminal domain/subunit